MERSITQYCMYCGVTWRYMWTLEGKNPVRCEPEKYGPYFENGQYQGRFLRQQG